MVTNDQAYVTIIGGANIDIQGMPHSNLIQKDSNPGKVTISLGGVGRNIAENLTRLGVKTKLITAICNDLYGAKILAGANEIGLDIHDSFVFNDCSTSTYLAILDKDGDMHTAISDMDIYQQITVELIKEKREIIANSNLCIIDTNIPTEVIKYIVTNIKGPVYFLDTVSTSKAMKVKEIIGYFHTIKTNKIETEVLTEIEINNYNDLRKSAEYFLQKGVKRVFITLGEQGLYVNDGINEKKIPSPKVKVINVTGAGDALVAALAYSYLNKFSLEYTAQFALSAAILALSHENTINPAFVLENVNKIMRGL